MPAAMIQGAPAYYWEKDYDRITQALMGLNQMLDEREKEKERRKARDMAMLQNDPRMAAGPAGKQFMETYADDPQAIAFVESLASQGNSQMNLEAGQSSYFEGLFQAQQEAGRRAAEFMGVGRDLQDSADLMNEADMWIGNQPDPMFSQQGMFAQNLADQQAFTQNQEDPRWTAYSGLPPEQRAEMGPWLSQKGQMPMPKILGVGMEAVDPKLMFASQNMTPEDLYNYYLRESGLLASPDAMLNDERIRADWARQPEIAQKDYEYRLALEEARRKTKQTPPGKAPKGAAGPEGPNPMGGKGTDEIVDVLDKSQEELKKAKVPLYSSTAAQEVARIIGSATPNGKYAGKVAVTRWKEIVDRFSKDPKFAQAAQLRGDTPESAWLKWAEGYATGQYK